ncbi:MAG: hypothetical protein E7354_02420 [Clostridiales bacterium]|nr:hypothetical protein [Clostridiales bacterium]
MKKSLKITLIAVSSVLVCIMAFLSIYYLWPWNKDFFDKASKEFNIPGLETDFVPQGMSHLSGDDDYLVSGYMSKGGPSRIYQVDGESGEVVKYITLKCEEEDYVGHAGGVVSYGSSIWVVGDGNLYRFTLSEFLNKKSGEYLHINAYTDTLNGADFVFASNGVLWVGEFYREGNYETNESHHLKTRSGEINRAVAYGFTIDETKPLGLYYESSKATPIPAMALSLPDLAQGIAIAHDNKIVLSSSYSLADSHLMYYENVFADPAHSSIRYGLYDVPLWFLDNDALISNTTIPAMSQNVLIKNNMVYILFESASKKYKIFNRVSLDCVYSMPISAL